MKRTSLQMSMILVWGASASSGCGQDITSPPYDPVLPIAWAAAVNNPWFPLAPGASWEYEGQTDEGLETIVVEVSSDRRMVNGVSATVVRDRVYLRGSLIEDTFDWYAQDTSGNVWYLGEDSKEIRNGQVVGTSGSWEWGRDGALPGVMMWANPGAHLNEDYRQEYYRGQAEDWGKVIGVGESATVRAGAFSNCIRTEDWNGLEGRSESLEVKTYCAGVGTVLELPPDSPDERVQLVTRRTGG